MDAALSGRGNAVRLDAPFLRAAAPLVAARLLAAGGHRALFVGGCVRDGLLGRVPGDVDIATEARPERVMELAGAAGVEAVPTGIAHGTVTLVAEGQPVEVTTFRRDVQTDGRHAVVAFSDSVEEDAARRDFTMNALYATPEGAVLDPTGEGLADLAARRVRFIGDPAARIAEDALRILRFFRFQASHADPEGGIDAEGLAASAAAANMVEGLSRERVGAEMLKLLAAADPAPAVSSMEHAGVLWRVLPGASAQGLAPLVHAEERLGLAPEPVRRLVALGGEDAFDRLRLSRVRAAALARLRSALAGADGPGALGFRLGADEAASVLALRGAGPEALAEARHGARARFPVRAEDLMPGLSGRALGERLDHLTERWISSGFRLTRAGLLAEIAADPGAGSNKGA